MVVAYVAYVERAKRDEGMWFIPGLTTKVDPCWIFDEGRSMFVVVYN